MLELCNEDIGNIKRKVYKNNPDFLPQSFRERKGLYKNFLNGLSTIAIQSDWKALLRENTTPLNQLNIWVCTLKDISEIESKPDQIELVYKLSKIWFDKFNNWENIIEYNLSVGLDGSYQSALAILKFLNKTTEMENLFINIIKHKEKYNKPQSRLQLFYSTLKDI